MFAPKLYQVLKFTYRQIIDNDFRFDFERTKDRNRYAINQQDNLLFRQIRLITEDSCRYNKYIVFVDIKSGKSDLENLSKLIKEGFYIDNKKYIMSERSASMTRQATLSFVREDIEKQLVERVTMGLKINRTVLSKYVAYRGLMLSSCHCIENWKPKIIVVSDYMKVIKNQKIKHLIDEHSTYIDKETEEEKQWVQKGISESVVDYEINVFDGMGIHHPYITYQVEEHLKSKTKPTSIMWRAPFIKGVTHEMDYTTFLRERNVEFIVDIWGEKHSIDSVMIIMTESMYKGFKYFKDKNTFEDWTNYWNKFDEYNHCIGIAKWNFSLKEEPVYTRANYQILQDLELPFNKFIKLAKYSISWIEKILGGDKLYSYAFLGLTKEKHEPLNNYMKALLMNEEMFKEESIRKYLISLFKKYINEMKSGKLWIKSTFKISCVDLIMFMEYIGGLEPKGCLNNDEFYTNNLNGSYKGEYLIERNPHITRSEHVLLNAVENSDISRWCSHLSNICMINGQSLVLQQLNGSDVDGDLVLVIDNEIMKEGAPRNIPIVIDTEDKITALDEEYNKENLLALVLRTVNSLIGEISNTATCYINKNPKSEETKQKYLKYVDILSIINGKAIDFAKTGVIFNIPRHIAKYAKPLPYFMKYASSYYAGLSEFANTQTNMNRLCWEIEKWEKNTVKHKQKIKDFNYKIMTDENIPLNKKTVEKIERVFQEYTKEMAELAQHQYKFNNHSKYKNWISLYYPDMTQDEIIGFKFDWQHYYDLYKDRCQEICPNEKELANIVVQLCYEKYSNKDKSFIWKVAPLGVLENLSKNKSEIYLPSLSENGKYEYLGRFYDMEKI